MNTSFESKEKERKKHKERSTMKQELEESNLDGALLT